MKRILIYIISLFFFCSCATQKNIITQSRIIDSISYKIDTVYINIPSYENKSFVSLPDTLKLETDIASAYAYVDNERNILIGDIKNKDTVYLTKEVYLPSRTIIKDSIIYNTIEIEKIKEVKHIPTIYKYSLIFSILTILFIGIYIFIKLKY